jgi:hypothetical protein
MSTVEEKTVAAGPQGGPDRDLEAVKAVSAPGSESQDESSRTEIRDDCQTPAPKLIPRAGRRGLFGRFTLIPEVASPSDYPRATKWLMTSIVALAGATSSTGSSIFYRKSLTNGNVFEDHANRRCSCPDRGSQRAEHHTDHHQPLTSLLPPRHGLYAHMVVSTSLTHSLRV